MFQLLRYASLTAFVVVVAASLSACHDDESDSSTAQEAATPATAGDTGNAITGTVAVGGPIIGATVSAICTGGNPPVSTTSATGAYSLALPSGVTVPCFLRAIGGTFAGSASPYALHSFAVATGTNHITLVTELIVARAAGISPSSTYTGFTAGVAATLSSGLAAAKTYVRSQLVSVLPGVPVPATDFITGPLSIGDMYDKMMEALRAALVANGRTIGELTTAAVAGSNFSSVLTSTGGGTFPVQWGSLTITGAGIPAGVQPTFSPNALPQLIGSSITWRNVTYPSAGATPTTNQSFIATFSSLPAGSLVGLRIEAPAAGVNGNGITTCATLPGCGGVTHDTVNKTLTLQNVQMTIGAINATLNGTLRYSDLAARAGTTMTSANLGTCPTTSSNLATGEPDATSLNCLAGTLNGISELGNSCAFSVDTTLKRAKLVSDDLDSAITFQTGLSGGNLISNLLHSYSAGAILNTHSYAMRDPLSGSATAYRDTVITVDKPASAAGPFTVRTDATVRSGGTSGPITSRGACTARLP